MLRGVLERESGGFAIDLTNVLLVDREAVKLLALSEAKGTELRNCPPYVREWIKREREATSMANCNYQRSLDNQLKDPNQESVMEINSNYFSHVAQNQGIRSAAQKKTNAARKGKSWCLLPGSLDARFFWMAPHRDCPAHTQKRKP